MTPPIKVVALDPGKTTGWASFKPRESPVPAAFGEVPLDHFQSFLAAQAANTDVWVVENYIINPSMFKHQWDKGDTLRLIGMVQYAAYLEGAKFILQQPSQKPMAYKIAGMEYTKGKKGMHVYDAIAHGSLYLAKNHNIVRENINTGELVVPKSYRTTKAS